MGPRWSFLIKKCQKSCDTAPLVLILFEGNTYLACRCSGSHTLVELSVVELSRSGYSLLSYSQ